MPDTLFDAPARSGAVISPCGRYRYSLWRQWDESKPWCVFVMLNPSTADAEQDDPTIRRCVGFAKREGCGGLRVVNLFALRSTDPAAILADPEPIGPDNDGAILLATIGATLVIAAWGAGAKMRPDRCQTVCQMLRARRLQCLGTTKDGHPRHPIYVSSDAPLCPFGERPHA